MLYNTRTVSQPATLDEATDLLIQGGDSALALYGSFALVPPETRGSFDAVVDLSNLPLQEIESVKDGYNIGAMVTLTQLIDKLPDAADGLLAQTAHLTAASILRNQLTIGTILAQGSHQMPIRVALEALHAEVLYHGDIITGVHIDTPSQMITAYEQVGRTPKDQPIVNVAGMRLVDTYRYAIGGLLADKTLILTESAFPALDAKTLIDDALGSAPYRRDIAETLVNRVHTQLSRS